MSVMAMAWGLDEDQADSPARAELGRAQRTLNRAISRAGRPLPCCSPGPNLWLSEERTDRSQAAARCGACPVLAECAAVGAAAPLDTWGVYGGHDYASDMDDLAELRELGPAVFGARGGAVHRARRDELIARLGSDPRWSAAELAEAVGTSTDVVRRVLRRHGLSRRNGRGTVEGRRGRRMMARQTAAAVAGAEIAGLDGPIVRQLRTLGRPPLGPAGDRDRTERDRLLRDLWQSEPTLWTWARLGAAAGISTGYARAIVRGYRTRADRPADELLRAGRAA